MSRRRLDPLATCRRPRQCIPTAGVSLISGLRRTFGLARLAIAVSDSAMIDKPERRRFPPPWSVDVPDTKLGQDSYIVRDGNGHALAYVYF